MGLHISISHLCLMGLLLFLFSPIFLLLLWFFPLLPFYLLEVAPFKSMRVRWFTQAEDLIPDCFPSVCVREVSLYLSYLSLLSSLDILDNWFRGISILFLRRVWWLLLLHYFNAVLEKQIAHCYGFTEAFFFFLFFLRVNSLYLLKKNLLIIFKFLFKQNNHVETSMVGIEG